MGSPHLVWLALLFLSSSTVSFANSIVPVPAHGNSTPLLLQRDQSPPPLCYYDQDKLAPDYIVPCWTTLKKEVYGCCKAGNHCLEHNACYDGSTGVTYQYGCTDPDYFDDSCPRKCGWDSARSNWIGLIFCNGTFDLPKQSWVCHSPENCYASCPQGVWDPQIEKLPHELCEDVARTAYFIAFKERSVIEDTVVLPALGDPLVKYFSENEDRWLSTGTSVSSSTTATADSSSTTASTMTSPIVTAETSKEMASASASDPSQPSSSSNSTAGLPPNYSPEPSSKGRTVGMAVGLGAGIPMVLAGIGFLLYYLRRRRNKAGAGESSDSRYNASQGQGTTGDTTGSAYGYTDKAELPAEEKAELAANDRPGPSHIAEMAGSIVSDGTRIQSPLVSPLLSEYSGKGDVREHRISDIDRSPVYELAG